MQIVLLKGIFSGTGSILIGLFIGERITNFSAILAILLIGFFAYGLSIYFYVYAQRILGAARTSAYYAVAPFISVIFSLIIFKELPSIAYYLATILMIIGVFLSSSGRAILKKVKTRCTEDKK